MNLSFLKWLIFTFRQNRRYLLVALCGFCIVIPLCFVSAGGASESLRELQLIFATAFSVLMAIYLFRFLYQRGAATLTFAMPISRRRLFVYHWLCGYLLVLFLTTYYTWVCSGWNAYRMVTDLVVSLFFQSVIYAITVFFVSRCRRTLDAVLIGYGWIILLALLQVSFEMFISSRSAYLIEAYSYYGITSDSLSYYLTLFSLPHLGSYLYYSLMMNFGPISIYVPIMLWWTLIAVAATGLTLWRFPRLVSEECGVYTRSYFVYPFGILILTLSLLNCIQWNEWTPFFFVMIFLIYAALYFVYKRSVRFTAHMLIGFVLLTAFEVAASMLFITTNGFGYIQEIHREDSFDTLMISLPLEEFATNISEENNQLIEQVLANNSMELSEGSRVNMLTIWVPNDSALLEDLQRIQGELMEEADQANDDYAMQITYQYIVNEQNEQYFDYIGNRETMNRHLHDLLVLLLEPSDQFDLGYTVYTYTISDETVIYTDGAAEITEEAYPKEGEADV